MDDVDFADLIGRARAGEGAAISAILSQFEPEVRTMVRVRLPRALRNQFDSMDFVQAIWTSVFTGKADECVEFADAHHFRGYLAGVARNKVFEEHRRLTRTKKYDLGREERLYVRKGEREVPREVAAPDPSASETFQARDRFGQLTEGRSADEVKIVELRRQGLTFEEIAKKLEIGERSVRRVIESIRERDAIRARMENRQWR
ncbi:RNA polymerase sigma factor [Tundrisphaera lichenicola]|uniref:RNA polymerase sigma factor n=1 Tax=Tundrisphaera lichenicola TaxID=2029860 RepID=UPI003EB9BCC9